jgi:Domain of unknown function (DUF4331)
MEDHMKLRTLTAALLAAAAVALPGLGAQASSHREAPFITEMPKVDGTDFYMFRSYEPGRENFVTIIANYMPLQDAYGGPNYFTMDPEALYEIHIDNNGDGREDITFQFNFDNDLINKGNGFALNIGGKDVAIPLRQFGFVKPNDASALNEIEKFKVTVVRGDRRFSKQRDAISNATDTPFVKSGSTTFTKPVDNIGNRTIADYAGYAANHIYNVKIPGCGDGRMFVGQRKEGFVVNLGETFDLINIKEKVDTGAGQNALEPNTIGNKNITTLALEVPVGCLTDKDPVIGGWTTASMRQGRLLRSADSLPGFLAEPPTYEFPSLEGGPWVQVSRLGSPLVNEVVIGLKDKNKFNNSEPKDDAQFADYVTNPTLPELIDIVLSVENEATVDFSPKNFPRGDLVAAFLTGIPGLNQPKGVKAAEMLRLNTSIAVTPKGSQKQLGAAVGDAAGFPNGRRPGDDVVDIELTAAEGVLCVLFPNAFGCNDNDVPLAAAFKGGATITDGAFVSDQDFDNAFPYLRTPVPGSPNGVSDF